MTDAAGRRGRLGGLLAACAALVSTAGAQPSAAGTASAGTAAAAASPGTGTAARPGAAGGTATVLLQGSLGADKALLLIDGVPQVLAVGSTARGVTLRRLADGEAQVDLGGQRLLLRLGAAPVRVDSGGPKAAPAGNSIVLSAGPGGHFVGSGQINGRAVQFLVDTGATNVAISQAEATRIGLDWRSGQRGFTSTANGTVPVSLLTLSSVRLGGVELANVAAVVVPSDMPMVLLGNSFLNRFSMRRDADVLRLDKKP